MLCRKRVFPIFCFLSMFVPGGAHAFQVLDEVEVVGRKEAPATGLFGGLTEVADTPATVAGIDAEGLDERQFDRPEDALQAATGVLPAVSQAGLGSGLQARGFDGIGRFQFNGHQDIQRLFVRDMATVARVEVAKGFLGVLYGQGAPGATVNLVGKRPQGSGISRFSLGADSDGAQRVVVDVDSHADSSPLTWRLVGAAQTGDSWIENVPVDRHTLFASGHLKLPGNGSLRVDAEIQRNQRPFSFGTVYVGGRFIYDRSYVAPAAHSDRRYRRLGIDLEQPLGNDWQLDAFASLADVKRDETLAGFWTIKDDDTLTGYYRELRDRARESSFGASLRRRWQLGDTRHEIQFGGEQARQRFDFSGPQNIAGFTIPIDPPDFSGIDFSSLPLSPKISRETETETGWFVVDRVQIGSSLHLLAGLRQTALSIDSDNGTVSKQLSDMEKTLFHLGGLYRWSENQATYATYSESFLPNRGQDRFGDMLPPRSAHQYEVGWHAGHADYFHLAAFAIEQNNLTTTDPADRTALIAVGSVFSRGLEVLFRQSLGRNWALSGQLTGQRVGYLNKTKAAYGDQLPSVPKWHGALTLHGRVGDRAAGWLTVMGVGQRQGDLWNTFTAPAYARLDFGTRLNLTAATSLSLIVRNLTDLRYVAYLTDSDNVYQGDRRNLALILQVLH